MGLPPDIAPSQDAGIAHPVPGRHSPMLQLKPALAFAPAHDGTRLACVSAGRGPTLIQPPAWMGHLAHDGHGPMAGPLLHGLAAHHHVVRYDPRGAGMSDRLTAGTHFEAWVQDLDSVVQAVAAPPRFALLGISQGAAVALAYAARYPERVSRLVLHGGYARGALVRDPSAAAASEAQMLARLVELGWGRADAAFRQLFTTQIIPGGNQAQHAHFNELQRLAANPDHAARLMRAFDHIDVSALLPLVRCPVLVLHSRHDQRVPFDEGRFLAGALPDAEFVPVASNNHLLLDTEPAWPRWLQQVQAFLALDATEGKRDHLWQLLTERQRGLTELIAQGCCNGQIAARLGLSERTVRNNVTMVFDKLGVHTRSQAIVRLRESGFGAARA